MGIVVAQPYKMFFDRDGNPLENGYIYVGTENMNAETNPIAIYWDEALTLPGAQPIRTLAGYPVRNGTPANIFVAADYSITVRDKNLALVYSSPNGSLISDEFGSAIHNATADPTPDDADEVPMWDTATGALGKFTIANLIAKLAALTTTWGLSITGNAATATTATTATNVTNFNAFNAYLSANQTAGATLLFDTVTQTGSAYNPATGIFTAPATGWYSLTAGLQIINNSAGTINIGVLLLKNGTVTLSHEVDAAILVNGGVTAARSIAIIVKLTVGDTVSVFSNVTLSATIVASGIGSGNQLCYFSGALIGN